MCFRCCGFDHDGVECYSNKEIIERERKEQEQTPAEIRNTSSNEQIPRDWLPELTENLKTLEIRKHYQVE